MNRFCNVVMTVSAVAVVFSTVFVTLRGQGMCKCGVSLMCNATTCSTLWDVNVDHGIYRPNSPFCFYVKFLPFTVRGVKGRITGPNPHAMILHKVYLDAYECKGSNYFSYTSPFGCYNPNSYDGSQTYDVYDELLTWDRTGQPQQFRRTYYYSTDGSCQSQIEGVSMESWLGGKMCSTSSGDNHATSEQESLTYSKSWTTESLTNHVASIFDIF
jgi:hypothetical protein